MCNDRRYIKYKLNKNRGLKPKTIIDLFLHTYTLEVDRLIIESVIKIAENKKGRPKHIIGLFSKCKQKWNL